jgi:hypothetical protein
MGQAAHAARIIAELLPSQPVINDAALRDNAKHRLLISGNTDKQRNVSRYHRDGLIFEAISWTAAQQEASGKALVRDPHLSSTTQGLDGLMIELDKAGKAVTRATIFEDKCSENPDHTFNSKILPAFKVHHENRRAAELVATAAALITKTGLDGTESIRAAARVLDVRYRAYRASLALTTADDTLERRKNLNAAARKKMLGPPACAVQDPAKVSGGQISDILSQQGCYILLLRSIDTNTARSLVCICVLFGRKKQNRSGERWINAIAV